MNLLIEKECNEALTRLLRPYFAKVSVQNVYHDINKEYSIEEDSNLLTLLIIEHFSNPPLKFEELKEGMWVWDNQLKWFFKVVICNVKVEGYESLKMFKVEKYEGGSTLMLFEPNRFYRKEVQE